MNLNWLWSAVRGLSGFHVNLRHCQFTSGHISFSIRNINFWVILSFFATVQRQLGAAACRLFTAYYFGLLSLLETHSGASNLGTNTDKQPFSEKNSDTYSFYLMFPHFYDVQCICYMHLPDILSPNLSPALRHRSPLSVGSLSVDNFIHSALQTGILRKLL